MAVCRELLLADPFPSAIEVAGLLSDAGYAVHRASCFDEACAIAQRVRPELAVTELVFGERSGIELIEHLHNLIPGVRIAVVTAFGSLQTAHAAVRAGAVGYLAKPTAPCEILATLGESTYVSPAAFRTLEEVRAAYIREVFAYCGSIAETARALSVDRRSLRRMMVRMGLRPSGSHSEPPPPEERCTEARAKLAR